MFKKIGEWFKNTISSWFNKQSGAALTGAEQQANAFNAQQSQIQRDWEQQMSDTAYQRQVADMRAAGLNVAMALHGSGADVPSGAAATSVSPSSGGLSLSDILEMAKLKPSLGLLKAQADKAEKEGDAALIQAEAAKKNAGTNERNAGTNERNAGTNERRVAVEETRLQIERELADSKIELNSEEKANIAQKSANLKVECDLLPSYLAIAEKNASSAEKQALAALKNADAAVQNAATNDRLADYHTSLMYAEELLKWSEREGKDIVNKYLPERTRVEIDNLRKEGVYLDKRGNLVDKQGNLVTAQTVKTYVNCATDVSGAVNQWINPLSKGAAPSGSPGFDLSGAYQGVAYGYE